MSCYSAAPRHLWPQSVVVAVVVAFTLHPTLVLVAAHQPVDGVDENHFVMFPGKATWGPSPMAGGSLAVGKVLSLVRPTDAKIVATSVALDEVKVGLQPTSAALHRASSLHRLPTGYTVGASHLPIGSLVRLKGGISGDSPYVLTRRQNTRSTGLLASSIKRLN